ncbi:hypothetical protein ABZ234_31880 [Nocardiopsis sp. NPDC006198]|uniref:hypothetical protein n=1 Tax=Nocardiopsis sp. NPDC006198 TaxID=3154472 RepID=UPI0033BFAD53
MLNAPNATAYRASPDASRAWWHAHQILTSTPARAEKALLDRHGIDGYLDQSTIIAEDRPPGCRPAPAREAGAWVPDRRTRTGQALHAQIRALPTGPVPAEEILGLPGAMPYNAPGPRGLLRRQATIAFPEQVLHLLWEAPPAADLDPGVWTQIPLAEYTRAQNWEIAHWRRRGLDFHLRGVRRYRCEGRDNTLLDRVLDGAVAAADASVQRCDPAGVARTEHALARAGRAAATVRSLSPDLPDREEQAAEQHRVLDGVLAELHTLALPWPTS